MHNKSDLVEKKVMLKKIIRQLKRGIGQLGGVFSIDSDLTYMQNYVSKRGHYVG